MKQGYKDYIMLNKHPYYVVFLTMDPAKVDFNIHPTKKVVRFEEEEVILATLSEVMRAQVNKIFGKTNTTGQLDESVRSPGKSIEEYIQMKENALDEPQASPIESPSNNVSTSTLKPSKSIPSKEKKTKNVSLIAIVPKLLVESPKYSSRDEWIQTKCFPKMRLISESGQLNKVYFVFEGEDGYYILDMHAADERINFEKEQKLIRKGVCASKD